MISMFSVKQKCNPEMLQNQNIKKYTSVDRMLPGHAQIFFIPPYYYHGSVRSENVSMKLVTEPAMSFDGLDKTYSSNAECLNNWSCATFYLKKKKIIKRWGMGGCWGTQAKSGKGWNTISRFDRFTISKSVRIQYGIAIICKSGRRQLSTFANEIQWETQLHVSPNK